MTRASNIDVSTMTPSEAAGFWDARLRSPDCTEDDRTAHRKWQSEDPAHAREFEALQGLVACLPSMAGRAEIESLRSSAKDWAKANSAATERWPRRWTIGLSALAASLLLVYVTTFLVGALDERGAGVVEEADASFATVVGERATIPLDDGSAVVLNTNSKIDVRFAEKHREVELLRGEAHFDVAHDATRPFTVSAGNYRVTAIGTAFDVRLQAGGEVTVIVTEGLVALSRRGEAKDAAQATQLGEGRQLRTTSAGAAIRQKIDPVNTSAWRQGRAVFDDIPLALAVEEMNRYSSTKIVVDDPILAETRVSGMFATGDQDSFVEALEQYFSVSARRTGKTEILLERDPQR